MRFGFERCLLALCLQRNGGIDEREVQLRRDEMLARQMQVLTPQSAHLLILQGTSTAYVSSAYSQLQSCPRPDSRPFKPSLSDLTQAHSFAEGAPRGFGSGGNSGSSGGGSYGGYGSGSGNRGSTESDVWMDTLNAVSSTVEQNMKVAASYASSLSSWASTLIANLDPTSLLFEDDDEYDRPFR